MKKKMIFMNILLMLLALLWPLTAVRANETNSVEEQIRAFVYTFDNLETDVNFVKDLKDINDCYSFSLYNIVDYGYAITVKSTGNIVDIYYGDLPNTDSIYYLGANTFATSLSSTIMRSLSIDDDDIETIKNSTETILNENSISFKIEYSQPSVRSAQKTKPSVIEGGNEVGINDSRMDLFKYNYWVNTDGKCGAYVAAAMLSYMDKYVSSNFINETVTISSNYDYAMYILGRTKQYITGSTTTYGVANCMNSIMYADYPTSGHTSQTTATESTYKSKISSGRPVIFFLPSYKNNAYGGGHFVLGYKYVDYNGYLWYKAYDNWSGNNNRGWINRNWIENGIYLI